MATGGMVNIRLLGISWLLFKLIIIISAFMPMDLILPVKGRQLKLWGIRVTIKKIL